MRQSPTLDDARAQFPNATVKVEANGDWCVSVTDRADMKRAARMLDGVRAADRSLGQFMQASQQREMVRMANGRKVEVTSDSVDIAKRRYSFKPVIRWGKPKVRGRCLPDGGYEEARKNPDGSWSVTRWTKAQMDDAPRKPVK